MTELDELVRVVSLTTAERLFSEESSPLDAILVVPVWRNEGSDHRQSAPTLLGEPEALAFLCTVLRGVIERIERGDYATMTAPPTVNSKGGSG